MAASLALWNKAASSASVAEERTGRRMEERPCTAPLFGGGGVSGDGALVGSVSRELMKKWPPARERAFFSDK